MIKIPLSGGASNSHQTLYCQLGDDLVQFDVNWRTYLEIWVADIYIEGTLMAAGVSLLPDCEISTMYPDLTQRLFFIGDTPTLDNLGTDNSLVYYDE